MKQQLGQHYNFHTMHVKTHCAPYSISMCVSMGVCYDQIESRVCKIFLSAFFLRKNRRGHAQAVCSTHGRAGAVNTQHLAVKTGLGLTVSPWHLLTESTQRPRPIQQYPLGLSPLAFTKEKVNKMVEQIQVT